MPLGKFFELTEGLYVTQQSQSCLELQWSDFETLLINLEVTLNQQIPEKYQFQFIEFLLKYIELALSYLSSFKITQYALQMKYFSKLLYFLPEALNAQKLCNLFVTTSTMGILDLLIYINFSTFAKRHLLFVFNRNLEKCDQETKEATGTENVSYIYKLMDLLPTYGDYSLQCDIMETVFRLYPHLIKSKDLKYSILPEMPELGAALSTEISPDTFDSDIRAWLSKFNRNSPHIFSIKARKVTLGNVLCTPHQADMIWLDFNLKDQVLSFSTVTGVNNCEWNLLYFPVQYVKSVEVCKPQSFVEIKKTTVVNMILTKPCISANNQSYWNTVGKTLEIVISDEKNEQTSWLISHVLPKMFGRVFQHRSSIRRSTNSKRVYRPLKKRQLSKSRSSQASRSKRKSSIHNSDYVNGTDLSGSLESKENSPFDGQSCVTSKICVTISTKTVAINQKSTKGKPTDDLQKKISFCPTASLCSNNSLDMTNFSRTDSNAFTSRPVTPTLERIESLQDNIVTSSNMFEDEIIISSSDIPLGQSKSRGLPSIIESVDFQPSELFSSSPFHRSVNTQEFIETANENLKEDFEVAALRLAQFDLDSYASQKIEEKSTFIMEVDESSGKQSILKPPQIVEVDSVKESSFVDDKYSVAINTNFETVAENQIYVDDLNVSNKEFEVAQRLTQFELNTQSSEQQAVVEYTNGKSVGDKRTLDQLAFKSTNSDFETAIEGPNYSWDNLSKTDVVEKRSLVQIPLKDTTEATHDSGNLENTDVGTVVENQSLDQGAVKATNKNLGKTELRNEDVAQRLTQFELNSQGEIEECHLLDVTSQQSVTNNTEEVNQKVKRIMTQESSHSQTELTNLKPKLREVLDTVDGNQEVMAQESISDYQSSHLSPLTEEAVERIEVDEKLLSPESSQSSRLSASLKLTEETQKVQFTTKLLRVNLVREPLIKIRTKKMDSETASPAQNLTQSSSFIPSDLNQAKCVSEGSVYTQFETVAKRLTQFQLDSDPQLEEANIVKPVEYLVPNQKPEGLKNLIVNLVRDPTIIAEGVITVPEDLTSNNVETVEHSLTPDFDKTTQDLFTQLSPDTQGRQTVPEESSEDVFHHQTQDLGDLSLKVNVGVFTNESTMDKNVLQFTEVESAVEEVFIELTKDEVAEIEVMEDRQMSTQELLTVLDKTVSQKSLNAKPADTTIQKCAPALIELSQDQKEASCKMPEDMDKISVTVNSLSPDTQARQTVPEESSDDVFNLRTQDVIGQLSLKVNVGVFTNESTMDKNVLQFTKVESAVEEIFIDLTKDDVAEIEVMEDRHLSTQELLIVLDKTVSEKSLNVLSPAAAKLADTTVEICASTEIEQSQDQNEASFKIQEDIDKITVINSPTTEERKTILEEPESEVFANYHDTNATKSAANILKKLIHFLEENNKAEEESLTEKPLYKKPKKDKPTKKESKPKKYPPRTLFDENNLSYMDTLNWSTPDYDSGQSYHDNHTESIKVVKRKLRNLKNNSTSKKDKKQRKRKPKRMKIESSMQGLICGVSHIKTTEESFPVLKNPRKRTFSKYDPFWDAVARDVSEIPASKSTIIQAGSDSSPFFTDGSSASSQKLPELETEPIGFNFHEQRQSPKIRVLQNIVVAQPTQLRPVAELCDEPSPKKLKLDQDDEFLPVNVPYDHPVLGNNLMREAWEAMHKITTWIVRGKEKNVQNVIEFTKSLPHEE